MNYVIKSARDMADLVDKLGFLPFFENDIPGFSIEEMTPKNLWFSDDVPGPWEWKGPVISRAGCAYGKFYSGKAMFVSREWYPDFANLRRDGYDFDARWADGLASLKEKQLYEKLDQYPSLLSKVLKREAGFGKDGIKGFDTVITRLQMRGYVIISDFEKAVDKNGKEYGWGIGRYTTPEKFFGDYFANNVYRLTPRQSREKIAAHLFRLLPQAGEKQISKLIDG